MDEKIKHDAAREARKWKAISMFLAVIAVTAMALPYAEQSDDTSETIVDDGPIVINNETHGVYQIATVNIESGKVSSVTKATSLAGANGP